MDTYILVVHRGQYDSAWTTIESVVHDYQEALRLARKFWSDGPKSRWTEDQINSVSVEHWSGGGLCCVDDIDIFGRVDSYRRT